MPTNKHVIEVQGKGFGKVKGQAKGLGGAMGGLAKNVGLVAGAYFAGKGLINAFQFATRVGKEFEQSMANLKAISGATGSEMLKLSANARQLGASTKFTASQVGELSVNYAKLGFSAKEILKVSEATLNLASATGEDLATSASVAGGTLRGFGLEAKQTGMLTDVMAKSFSTSALDLSKFSESMKYVAPVAKVAGFSLQETTAILGQLANSSIDGSMAGTSLKNVLMQMTVPGSKLSKVFGGTVNNFEEFVAVLKKTKEQGGLTKTQLGMIPRLLQATIPVLIDSSDKMMAYKQSLDDAGGSAERMAEIQMATLEGKMLTLNSATEGLGISFFETFDDVLKGAVDGVISLVSALDSLIAVPMSAQLEENRTSAEGLFQVLERGNLTSETRKRLLDEINTKYGDLITTELTEVSTLGDIKKAHDEITGSIIKQIAVEQSREKIAKIMQGISDLRDREVGLISKQLNAENRLTTETTKHTEALSKAKVKQEEYNKTHGHSSAMMNQGRTAMTMQIEELENLQQATGYQTNASELSGIAMANAGFAYENTTDAVVRNQMEQYNLIQSMGDVQRKAEELAESLTNIATASGGGGSGKYDETAILLEFADVEEQIHFKKLQQIADQEAKYMDLNINKVAVMEWSAQQEKKLDAEVLASKMSYFSGLSGALSQLAGEHKQGALVAKRLAQVQAVIDTWAGANKALASAPPPWNFIAMATVIATGMANVANIESQTMAQGGFISGNSHAQGGVNINAEGGEFMMQRDAVSRIGVDTLSNMNEGGGGGITLNISAPLIDDTIIDVIVPAIDRARREGLA